MVVTHSVFGYTVHAKVVTNGLHGHGPIIKKKKKKSVK
jgi:hypothetical protein